MADNNPYAPPSADVEVDANDALDLAGRGARLGGALIDGLIAMFAVFPLIYMFGFWEDMQTVGLSISESILLLVMSFAIFLALHGYLLATSGQTIGKRLVGTQIVSNDDRNLLPFARLIGLRYLPISVVSQIPLIGPLLSLIDTLFIFREDRRCVHDLIAGTVVVNARNR